VQVGDDLRWLPFDIPDGIMPAQISVLRVEKPSRAQVLLVRFPPGWARPVVGSYEAAEELVVLEGSFTMSGERYTAGDWAYFPAGWERNGTASPEGMLGLARFDGPARWNRDTGAPVGALRAHLSPETLDEPVTGAFGSGYPLRDSLNEQAWFLTDLASGRPAPYEVEIFDLTARTWVVIDEGSPLPNVTGPVFARAFPRV
jgi:hypothetical protein